MKNDNTITFRHFQWLISNLLLYTFSLTHFWFPVIKFLCGGGDPVYFLSFNFPRKNIFPSTPSENREREREREREIYYI